MVTLPRARHEVANLLALHNPIQEHFVIDSRIAFAPEKIAQAKLAAARIVSHAVVPRVTLQSAVQLCQQPERCRVVRGRVGWFVV